jgi:electron transfer flavoprotein alpha subunit
MKKTLVFIEPEAWKDSIDLLGCAEAICAGETHKTYGVSFNLDDPEAPEAVRRSFDFYIPVPEGGIAGYDTVNIAAALGELHGIHDFDVILIAATSLGRVLAPRLAMILGAPLCADVTMVERRDGEALLVRPAFDGKMLAAISCAGKRPVMASIRSGLFSYTGPDKEGRALEFRPSKVRPCKARLVSSQKKEEAQDIRKSGVLVSAGAGVGRSFEKIQPLARELNGMTASSRKLVDKGITSRSIQVGQSGKTVSPHLYIALGISGAIQHVEGIKKAEHIISVNINRDAPLCSLSDIVVEGDAVAFAQKLTAKIKDRRKNTT